jgi:hypothetical protein
MERENYLERIMDVKNDILGEIREILGEGNTHYYANPFYVHYVDGEVAATEICAAVEVEKSGSIIFHVRPEDEKETEMVCGESVFEYEPESFMDILFNLKKEIREEKLSELRALVDRNGGKISFDGNFGFHALVGDEHVSGEKSMITCIELDKTLKNKVYLDCIFSGEYAEQYEEDIPLDELDRIIAYVKSQTKKKFTVQVSGSFSRVWEIEANTYQEAIEEAKKDWEINPLIQGDVNGEDWRSWIE